jgi:hypothetical protein
MISPSRAARIVFRVISTAVLETSDERYTHSPRFRRTIAPIKIGANWISQPDARL